MEEYYRFKLYNFGHFTTSCSEIRTRHHFFFFLFFPFLFSFSFMPGFAIVGCINVKYIKSLTSYYSEVLVCTYINIFSL